MLTMVANMVLAVVVEYLPQATTTSAQQHLDNKTTYSALIS